jgi:hypothetical protein
MTTTAAETWLDIKFAIPLEARCPVVRADGPDKGGPATYMGHNDVFIHIIWEGESEHEAYYPGEFVPDLDTAIGFGVAVRALPFSDQVFGTYLSDAAQGRGYNTGDDLLLALLCGLESTTPADRLALARACAEVTP